jgi:NAD+ kinase
MGTGGLVRRALLFVNLHKRYASETAAEIRAELEKRGIEAVVFTFESDPGKPPEGKWDIAFSLGGDGTVLYAARTLASAEVPIFPVNLGTLGFIAGVDRAGWLDVFERWLAGETRVSRRCMLEIGVNRGGAEILKSTCLNDAVISASGIAKLIKLDVHAEIAPGGWTELGFYRADGLIIATPTGSTAYSMAAGGPILDPEMEAMLLTPICPFTLSNRPLALPSKQALRITVADEQRSGVLLTVDGQNTFTLEQGDRILIREAPWQARLISADLRAYYAALREKLSWLPAPQGRPGGGEHA